MNHWNGYASRRPQKRCLPGRARTRKEKQGHVCTCKDKQHDDIDAEISHQLHYPAITLKKAAAWIVLLGPRICPSLVTRCLLLLLRLIRRHHEPGRKHRHVWHAGKVEAKARNGRRNSNCVRIRIRIAVRCCCRVPLVAVSISVSVVEAIAHSISTVATT